MPSPHIVPRLMRRQLITQPNVSNPESFILPIRKLLIEYNQQRSNQKGLRNFLSLSPNLSSSTTSTTSTTTTNGLNNSLQNPPPPITLYHFVKKFPFVEFVVKPTGGSGILKAFYLNNNRIKTIPVDKLSPHEIQNKMKILLNSTGQKLNTITRKNAISIAKQNVEAPTRGHYSALHHNQHTPLSRFYQKTKQDI